MYQKRIQFEKATITVAEVKGEYFIRNKKIRKYELKLEKDRNTVEVTFQVQLNRAITWRKQVQEATKEAKRKYIDLKRRLDNANRKFAKKITKLYGKNTKYEAIIKD